MWALIWVQISLSLSMSASCRQPSIGPNKLAIIPFGTTMLWNFNAWDLLWPLNTSLWFSWGLQIGRTVPSMKLQQLSKWPISIRNGTRKALQTLGGKASFCLDEKEDDNDDHVSNQEPLWLCTKFPSSTFQILLQGDRDKQIFLVIYKGRQIPWQ